MNKMMNPELEVVRFGAEDVIATSGGPLMTASYGFNSYQVTQGNTGYRGILTFSNGKGERIGDLGFNNQGENGAWQYDSSGSVAASWQPNLAGVFGDAAAADLIRINSNSQVITATGADVFNWFYAGAADSSSDIFQERAGRTFSWDGTIWFCSN